jgi:hypothetical protein
MGVWDKLLLSLIHGDLLLLFKVVVTAVLIQILVDPVLAMVHLHLVDLVVVLGVVPILLMEEDLREV